MSDDDKHHIESGMGRKANLVLIGFLVIAGYFLILEHRAHLGEWLKFLPYLLLLACPLMHLFMHRGHGNHQGHDRPKARPEDDTGKGGAK